MSSSGDMQFWRWREFIVDVLVGASAVALAFAAINANAEPILGAIGLVGIALMIAGDVGPQPLRPPLERESASSGAEAAADLHPAIVDAMSG
jgi:hypothetical protein